MLQKWIHYHLIPDHTEFWFSWDPSDPEDFKLLQKYEESDGSIAYLPNNLAKNLVSLWDFMNLLMKKDRPDGENNKLYYLMDEQWTKFTAYDMRSALIDEKQNSHMSPAATNHISHLRTPTSPLPVRSPMHLELASFKKSIKREASAYSTLKDERYFDKFQRDLFITAKSHNVSEILDPTFTPGSSPEEQELFEAKQVFMYKVFNETLLTDMGRTKVRKYTHGSTRNFRTLVPWLLPSSSASALAFSSSAVLTIFNRSITPERPQAAFWISHPFSGFLSIATYIGRPWLIQ